MNDGSSDIARTIFVFILVLGSLAGFSGVLLIGMVAAGSPSSSTSATLSTPRTSLVGTDSKKHQSRPLIGNFDATVEITNTLKFEPHVVTINSGQTVLWSNISCVAHTVTADFDLAADKSHVMLPEGAEPFNSDFIKPDQTWTKTFSVPGRYRYYCIPHEAAGMVGEIVVRE